MRVRDAKVAITRDLKPWGLLIGVDARRWSFLTPNVAGLLVAPGGQVRRHPEGEGPKETAANARQPLEPERTDAPVPDREFQIFSKWVSLSLAPLPKVPVALKLWFVCGCNSQLLQQMQQQTQPQAQSAGAATSPATLLASMQQLMGMQQLQAAGTGQSYSKYLHFFLYTHTLMCI